MGHRGSEGPRMPADWQSQWPRRPRSHSAPAPEPGDGGSAASRDDGGEDDAGFGSGEWQAPWPDGGQSGDWQDGEWQGGEWRASGDGYAGDGWYGGEPAAGGLADLARGSAASGPAASGPARGFPPAPDQADPVYPRTDFDAWSNAPGQAVPWDSHDGAAQRDRAPWDQAREEGGHWEAGRGAGQWDSDGGTADWEGAGPGAGEWAGGEASERAGGQPGHRDEAAGQWQEDAYWDTATGQWEAQDATGQWEGHDAHGDTATGQREGQDAQWDAAAEPWHQPGELGALRPPDPWESPGYPAGYDDGYAEKQGSRAGRAKRRRSGPEGNGKGTAAARMAAFWRGAAGGSRNRTIILAAAGAVVVAALGATAYTFLAGHSSPGTPTSSSTLTAPKLPTSRPTAASTSAVSRLGKWGYIGSRATDKATLTLGELYPAGFLINGSSFVRTTDRSDNDCTAALFGSQLQDAAKSNGCTQVLRASYMSSDEKMIGTVGVLNLTNASDAAKVGQATDAQDFVAPLAASTGPTRNMNQGTGVVQAEYKGHYLILIFAEFANLKAPSTTAARTELETFSSDLITGSANIALSNRMVNGHP